MNRFQAAVLDMAAAGYQERAKLARGRHLHGLVERIDGLIYQLEELQAAGQRAVPVEVRRGAGNVVSLVHLEPDYQPPSDIVPAELMDVLFETQDQVLTLLNPERHSDHN